MDRIPFISNGGKTSESFEDKLKDAANLIEYLETKGIRARQTRLRAYVEFYKRFLDGKCADEEIQLNLLFVMREMDEWSWIYRGLKLAEPPGYLELLRVAIDGTPFAKDEATTSHARNIQLELRVGSYFIQAGFEVSFAGLEDLVVTVMGLPVFVECKRLSSSKKTLTRAKEAAEQLKRRYSAFRKPSYGLVVMDVSRIIHPKQGISRGETEVVIRDGIRSQLQECDLRHDTSQIFSKDKKLISVWMQAIVPSYHLNGEEVCTRFSSLHSVYAKQGKLQWKLFEDMRRAFDVV